MDSTETAASALFAGTFIGALFVKLRQKDLLSLQDGRDILDFALLNLETHQALADKPEPVMMARKICEKMLWDLDKP